MSKWTRVSRRRFVILSTGATAAAGLLAACGAPAPPAPTAAVAPTSPPAPAAKPTTAPAAAAPPPTQAPPSSQLKEQPAAVKPTQFKEAPMLADLVKQGKLPPVGQRLPPEPLVVKPTNKIGKYGGLLRGAALAPETTHDLQVGMVVGLFLYSHDLGQATPEVATGYKFSPDNKSCTITLRKGLKWSDGQPFSADDVIFFFQDIQFNKDLWPSTPPEFAPGGQPMKVTKVDDATVQFDFAVPNPAFALIHYAGAPSAPWRPRHYLQPFHATYNPNADQEAKAAGFDSWVVRFQKLGAASAVQGLNYGAQNPDMPVLEPWRPVKNTSQTQEYERNPYYFKVDTEGNQLPYIDRLVVDYATGSDVVNLKTISGQLSVAGMDLLLANYPVLKQAEQQGGYKVTLVRTERGADVALALNQNHPDPVLKTIFNNVRFRQALSLGIDRGEINELVFLGQATPRQATINESASIYKKEWGEAFAKFDLAQANKLLDEVGLDKKGAEGVRLRPDGQPIAFQLEYLPQEGPKKEVCELVVKHWSRLGLKVDAAARERGFLLQRLNSGQHDASAWHVDRQLERAAYAYGASGSKLGPGGNSAITYARAWVDWFASGGKLGSEPPEDAKQLRNAFNAWQQTTMGTPEYVQAGTAVHELIAKTLWVIGIVAASPQPVIVKNDIENVFAPNTEKIWWGAANWFWKPHRQDQWFLTTA
jgi:peptide/nickel transport system substrate-binding protein